MTPEQVRILEVWDGASDAPSYLALRSRICLLAHQGLPNRQIAERLSTSRVTVLLWRRRFAEGGPAGLEQDAPRGPSSQRLATSRINFIVKAAREGQQLNGKRWSTRSLAKRLHVSHTTIALILEAHDLQPHRAKLQRRYRKRDQEVIQPVADIAGLFLNPPDRALVLCVNDLKVYDRINATSPAAQCRCGDQEHDHVRSGPAVLLDALSTAEGQAIGGCFEQPRHLAFLDFLHTMEQQTPREAALHLIVEDSPTLHHALVKNWLANHARFHVHVTPAGISWPERARQVFAEISRAGLRAHSFWSAAPLADELQRHTLEHKDACAPFVWTSRAMHLKTYVG
ncbi:MAG: IS630 family transposase, partial [Kiritimatiellaeota bacterium]|nr:IS630 family transposase [Kiritimatiellota bacterium]